MSAIRIGRVWLIAGPTASGKSALALRLARALDGEIVNADSMQVYRDLSLLTARPSREDEAQAPHHLFGVADGAEPWSVGTWLRAVGPVLAGIAARGRPAVVVGGTGLYFRALTRGLADIPAVPPAVRAEVAALFAEAGEAAFRQALARLDPQSAARIAPGDRQRLTRALEVAQASGRPIGDWQAQTRPVLAQDHRAVVIDPPRPQLYARCDARLTAMVQAGAADEVAALTARGLEPQAPVMKALGVQALARHLQGALSLSEALATAQQETRRYAKRQSTWFRGQAADWPRIEAMEPQAQWDQLVALGAPASASASA